MRAATHASRRLPLGIDDVSGGALVLCAALPVVFLHADYQPRLDLTLGSAEVAVRLSDLAVAAVGVAALGAARSRASVLRNAAWAWAVALALLAWVLGETLAHAGTSGYPFATELVTALKFGEYAVLAPAVPLLLRSRRDLAAVAWALVAWMGIAAAVGVLQLVGVDILDAWTAWRRQPSFLGHHDLAAVSAILLSLTTAGILLGPRARLAPHLGKAAGAAGGAALVVSGTVVGAAGFAAGAALAALVAWRRGSLALGRLLRLGALVAVVVLGVLAFRGGDVLDFARFLGIGPAEEKTTDVESYSQRSVLAYIGVRVFLDHPALGLGWQASTTERGYGPYLADAHRRFPTVADEAFPAPGREWGVQNAYVQAAADMGAPGALLFLGVVLAPLALAAGSLLRGGAEVPAEALAVAVLTLAVAALWVAQGLVAGIPLAAVTWLTLGLAARVAAGHGVARRPLGADAVRLRSSGT